MNFKTCCLIAVISLSLYGCQAGGGSSTAAAVSTPTPTPVCNPEVTLSSSANSIYESSAGLLTLTATLSCVVAEDVDVTIGSSGTATEGTDYSNVSDISVTAGNTTGTSTFDPTSDSAYESSNETAILSITGVSGGGATENGTQSVTITINEYALIAETAFSEGTSLNKIL